MALVCDMPAARLLGGFAHHSSGTSPCHMCKHADLDVLDEQHFSPRTAEEVHQLAEAWKKARTTRERELLYHQNGVRYSELLHLNYWDPVQNTVIDSMHGFYLQVLQRHCRDIWGMSIELEDCDGLWEVPEPTDAEKAKAKEIFQYGSKSAMKLNTKSLRYLAVQEGIDHRRRKNSLYQALLQLVSSGVSFPDRKLK